VLTGSADGSVRVWDTATWTCLRELSLCRHGSLSFAYHPPWVTAVEYLHDGRHAVLAATDGTLQIWDTETGERIRSLLHHTDGVLDLAVCPAGRAFAVSGSLDGDVRLWDLAAGASRRWRQDVVSSAAAEQRFQAPRMRPRKPTPEA
jgi:WD40 repeat protein